MNNYDLPGPVREIADVIGRESAMALVGRVVKWDRADVTDKRRARCGSVYIPRTLESGCRLLELVDREQAEKLVAALGGAVMKVSVPAKPIREYYRQMARYFRYSGMMPREIAEAMQVSPRQVYNLLNG